MTDAQSRPQAEEPQQAPPVPTVAFWLADPPPVDEHPVARPPASLTTDPRVAPDRPVGPDPDAPPTLVTLPPVPPLLGAGPAPTPGPTPTAGPSPTPGPVTTEPSGPPGPAGPAGWLGRARTRLQHGRRGDAVILGAAALVVVAVVALIAGTVLHGGGPAPAAVRPSASPTPVDLSTVAASSTSTQKAESGIDYAAANTLDGDPSTAWNSDGQKDGPGPGITLTYRFAAPVDLRSVTLLNGYQKVRQSAGKPALDLWRLNARIHRVLVVTDTGRWTWDLADVRAQQTLAKAFGRTATLKLQIVSVYRSDKYRDVALSEVSFRAA